MISRLVGLVRPGGMILFRDYGELDMAQLRFKKGSKTNHNVWSVIYEYSSLL